MAHPLIPELEQLAQAALVTAGGEYLGGNISPGMAIRFKSLNKYTNRLPLLERPDEKPPLLGGSTKEAIQSGIVNGIMFELDSFIGAMNQFHPEFKVVLTGGDAKYFEGKLKNSIFVIRHVNCSASGDPETF